MTAVHEHSENCDRDFAKSVKDKNKKIFCLALPNNEIRKIFHQQLDEKPFHIAKIIKVLYKPFWELPW